MSNSLAGYLLASVTALTLAACATAPQTTEMSDNREAVEPAQIADSYYLEAQQAVDQKYAERQTPRAKNVIIFIGDGMGVSTITSARIYAGRAKGLDGESYKLAMEKLPWSALSKTYSHDSQIADSAATATALVSGVKVPSGTLGVTQSVARGNCATADGAGSDSLFEIAEDAGLATGIVSTARITHATPASTYSHSVDRDWENDTSVKGGCVDIALQLIEWPHGDGFEVVLGGGRSNFLTSDTQDPEYEDKTGRREDGRDLMAEWNAKSDTHQTITDAAGFEAMDFDSDIRVLGLFEPSHMQFELDRAEDGAGEPSISDMTEAAIRRLSRDEDGYVLMVEGGRVDHAHHAGNAARALSDAAALDEAVAKAVEMTDPDETLIIVTADHSHTLMIAGYSQRNNPILGLSSSGMTPNTGADGKPYTTLGYLNGPGAVCPEMELGCQRSDLSDRDVEDKDFLQQSVVPMRSETHGGEDVAVFASGPGAMLVSGVMEQNEIFHVMGRSLGLVK